MNYRIPQHIIRIQIDKEVCSQLKTGDMLIFEDFSGLRYCVGKNYPKWEGIDDTPMALRKPDEPLFLYISKKNGKYTPECLQTAYDCALGNKPPAWRLKRSLV